MEDLIKEIDLQKKLIDHEGQLTIIEGKDKIPFLIDKIFYVHGKKKYSNSCYRNGKMLVINLNSDCIIDTSIKKTKLNKHNALFIEEGLFKEINNIDDKSQLLVLVSEDFNDILFRQEYMVNEIATRRNDENHNINYEIKRLYYISNVPNDVRRGYHAHKQLKQYLTCVGGNCTIMLDDGNKVLNNILDNPEKGIYVYPCKWREMYDFSKNSILVAIVSDLYDENDYIRNYDDFIKYLEETKQQIHIAKNHQK